jgi:DNA polymerase III subunit delta'
MVAIAGLERHPHAAAVLAPALAPGATPAHAYLFHGPAGAGKRRVAREVAAELLTAGVADPSGARTRIEHDTHPDLSWIVPSGAHEMLVGDVAGVVSAAARTPFEALRRVFVLERADTLVDAAANKLLKTLEEPPAFVHLILLTDRLGEVLPTVASRCQLVRFDPPAPAVLAAALEARGVGSEAAAACARLALGDGERAIALALGDGPQLRAAGERLARASLRPASAPAEPWDELLVMARRRGAQARDAVERQAAAEKELVPKRERRRIDTAYAERARRADRRAATAALDLGLQVAGLWFRDLAALRWGAGELAHNVDRADALAQDAAGREPQRLRAAVELVEDTRRRLLLNVSESLACEALSYRLGAVLAAGDA